MMITTIKQYKQINEENKSTDLIIIDIDNVKNNTYLLNLKKYESKFNRVIYFGSKYRFQKQITNLTLDFPTKEKISLERIESFSQYNKDIINLYKQNRIDKGMTFELPAGYFVVYTDKMDWLFVEKGSDLHRTIVDLQRKKSLVTLVGNINNVELIDTILNAFHIETIVDYEYTFKNQPETVDQDQDKILGKTLIAVKKEDDKKNESKNTNTEEIEAIEEIPDDMTIDYVVDIFTNQEEMNECLNKYGKHIITETTDRGSKMTPGLTHRYVKNNDVLWVVCMLKPRSEAAARMKVGEIGVVQVRVMKTFYGLNKLKQLKDKDIIIR